MRILKALLYPPSLPIAPDQPCETKLFMDLSYPYSVLSGFEGLCSGTTAATNRCFALKHGNHLVISIYVTNHNWSSFANVSVKVHVRSISRLSSASLIAVATPVEKLFRMFAKVFAYQWTPI